MSELLALGVSHKTAPVALRERLALATSEAELFAVEATATDDVREAVVLSTCNRAEIYAVVGDPLRAEVTLLGLLAARAKIRPTELADAIYSPRNCDAARQLFRVTAGLDSMIVGEAEVQGQVRRAYEAALNAGTTGPTSNRLFAAALTAGRRVRNETALGRNHVSISSVAVELASEVVGDLRRRNVVVLGAGETSELTAEALARAGAATIFVANRHADRALALAERFGGTVTDLARLPEQLAAADIVVASTASPRPIIGRDELAEVMADRPDRPLLLIDIAVPRDVEAGCGEIEGVTLYDIDDLQGVVARNLSSREEEMPRAMQIVEEEIARFAVWLGQLDALPTIAALRRHGEQVAEQVLTENEGRWEALEPADRRRVELLARTVVGRLLHEPTQRLRDLGDERGHAMLELVRDLFGLEDEQAPERKESALAEVHDLEDRRSSQPGPR
ncbi:MAG TPA: glutamyl-tRNA reductase [Solirubrobacteraceae bacterium]|nr:glutamyl-tRNA reductase [Solirubrobacteraceae bacterium]